MNDDGVLKVSLDVIQTFIIIFSILTIVIGAVLIVCLSVVAVAPVTRGGDVPSFCS